ncbi:MAG TPA: transglutaminase-like domain-containing protein [Vicinamibacterales bacterium]|nr:transglutaminase-like domain-containing protein [Vicinamibacterales bacterium]
MSDSLRHDFLLAATNDEFSTGAAALRIAKLEYAQLDPEPYLDLLDEMADEVRRRLEHLQSPGTAARLAVLNEYLYGELGFRGDRERYEDPRNSFLNVVLERRSGIPITLAVVFLEVARRVGLPAEGVNFPGHFLVRVAADEGEGVLIDPFHGGAIVSQADCHTLLRRYLGNDAALDAAMLAPASKRQILTRMLLNLKRAYVRLRSFPQARAVTDLLLALDPSSLIELRDRGLLAYHMQDFSPALRDLQQYLRLSDANETTREEHAQIWEYVKALRRLLAGLN